MSKVRDIVREIAEVRDRQRIGRAMADLQLRIFSLEQAFDRHGRTDSELARYFPVAIVACMEGYFRMAIKDLVDAGDPYFSNSEKLMRTVKLDFTLLKSIHVESITIGELIAHSVSLSRLDHIDSIFTCLLGNKYLNALRTVSDRWEYEVKDGPDMPIISNADNVFSDVTRTFELRHIITAVPLTPR